jgi:hypothetical protein
MTSDNLRLPQEVPGNSDIHDPRKLPHNPKVAGSNPAPAMPLSDFCDLLREVVCVFKGVRNGLGDRGGDLRDPLARGDPLTSREQLQAYLDDAEHKPSPESDLLLESDPPSPSAPSQPSGTPTASPGDAPRRWPQRST